MKVKGPGAEVIMFLCDRKACGAVCPNELCSHTSDICHAKNFDFVRINEEFGDYFELDEPTRLPELAAV